VLKATALSLLLVIMLVSGFALPGAFAQTKKGAYVDEIRFIHYEDEDVALKQVKAGELDAYYFKIPLEVASDVKGDPRTKVYDRLAGSNVLLLNPAPAKDNDTLNPFSLKQVRFAMNYLIDRELVVNEFRKGYGSPMVDPFGIYSPEYLIVIDTVESFGFRHNPQLAESMITEAMNGAGAAKESGKWTYGGKPVTVKILIRSDDNPRKLIGDDLASRLEKLGFAVQKEYGDLNKATTVVYGTDPQELQWQVYTEGFAGTSVFVKYNPIIPAQMYSPWFGRMPGFQNPAFWQYENATLDDITQRIWFANFTSQAERNDLVNRAVRMGIQESVRIFVNQNSDPFVASPSVKGLVNDFGSGITSKYSAVNARPSSGSTLDIGVKQIHQGAWNGIAGLQDTYSRDVYATVADSSTFRNPYTGDIIPMRVIWKKVLTEGPDGKLAVAQDAQVWDPAEQKWKAVGKSEATSKVTYNVRYSKWHHGMPMDKADLMYTQYFVVEWGTNSGEGDLTVDPEFTSQAEPGLKLIKGVKITGRSVESYVDYWHYDKKEIADFAAVWASEPWEITAATERLVTAGKIAYSRAEATVKGVDQLDLIVPSHAEMIKEELQKMKDEGYVPNALKGMVSASDAAKRYDASIKWIEQHKNAVIGNGPFYLDSYNIAGRTITVKAFRDSSYPFKAGHWAKFENPRLAKIVKADIPRAVTIGKAVTATITLQVDGKPSSSAEVSYFIFDKSGSVIVRGMAKPVDKSGTFTIEIPAADTAKLSAGPNTVKIFANSKQAFRPDIATATIVAAR
jgi:peptide/nickel transport system substrate-binding protein